MKNLWRNPPLATKKCLQLQRILPQKIKSLKSLQTPAQAAKNLIQRRIKAMQKNLLSELWPILTMKWVLMKNQRRRNLKLIRIKMKRTSKLSSKKLINPMRRFEISTAMQKKMESLKSNLKTLENTPLPMKRWKVSQSL